MTNANMQNAQASTQPSTASRFFSTKSGKVVSTVIGGGVALGLSEFADLRPVETLGLLAIGARSGYVGMKASWGAFKDKWLGTAVGCAVLCTAAHWVRGTNAYQDLVSPGFWDTVVKGIGLPVPEMTRIANVIVVKSERALGNQPFAAQPNAVAASTPASAASAPQRASKHPRQRPAASAASTPDTW